MAVYDPTILTSTSRARSLARMCIPSARTCTETRRFPPAKRSCNRSLAVRANLSSHRITFAHFLRRRYSDKSRSGVSHAHHLPTAATATNNDSRRRRTNASAKRVSTRLKSSASSGEHWLNHAPDSRPLAAFSVRNLLRNCSLDNVSNIIGLIQGIKRVASR